MSQAGSIYREFPVLRFKGLNNKYAPMHIADDEAADLMNVTFDELGAVTKRNGYAVQSSVLPNYSDAITSLFTFIRSDGTKHLLASAGTHLFDVTGATSRNPTWNDYSNLTFSVVSSFYPTWSSLPQLNFSIITSTLNGVGNRFTATTFYDKLYMVNGNTFDGLMVWDGTTFSQVAGAPSGQYVILHKNRLYMAGDPANPSRLYMSDLGEPTSWPALNFIDINTNDGDKITGIAEHLDSLVIFKERSIHVLRGSDPASYVMMDTHQTSGTVSHWSVAQGKNMLFYLGRDGVYAFDGKLIHLVSDQIAGSVLGIGGLPSWNQSKLNLACGVDYKHKYWIAVPEGTTATNDRVYVYDYIHTTWTRYDIPASSFATFNNVLYSGDPTQGIVYEQDTGGNDNGNAINGYLITKAYDFGAPGHFKSYKGLFFYAAQQLQGYSVNVSYIGDFGRVTKTVPLPLGASNASQWGSMTWGVSPWGAAPNVAARTTNIAGQSRYMQFKVQGNAIDQPFTFYGFVVLVNVKRRLR